METALLGEVDVDASNVFPMDASPRVSLQRVPTTWDFLCVPMQSIAAFVQIQRGFALNHPGGTLYLLHGPRQFGKTTIALHLREWIVNDPAMDDLECIYVSLSPADVKTSETFWTKLCRSIAINAHGVDERSFIQLATCRHRARFCLMLDNLDVLIGHPSVMATVLTTVASWRFADCFGGFLGIGSHNVVNLQRVFEKDLAEQFFNLLALIRMERFSKPQMDGLFDAIESRFTFSRGVRDAIAEYSSGAPGVYGSMVKCTIASNSFSLERWHWEQWFKLEAFETYLSHYNRLYAVIQRDLKALNQLQWQALSLIVARDGDLTVKDVERRCDVDAEQSTEGLVELFVRMGILMKAVDGKLSVVSTVMYRICVDAESKVIAGMKRL